MIENGQCQGRRIEATYGLSNTLMLTSVYCLYLVYPLKMNINAVEVSDISFKYGKTNVLQNIYACVPRGQIYALLGPSGSGNWKISTINYLLTELLLGKTTVLRLMLGRIKPSSGSITVFGSNKPGHFNRIIGYMPQSQALSPELTIDETMNYFASLYQLEHSKFESQ